MWCSGLLLCIIFWLCVNISEEHAVSIIRVKVRSVGKWMVYIEMGGLSGHRDWPNRATGWGGEMEPCLGQYEKTLFGHEWNEGCLFYVVVWNVPCLKEEYKLQILYLKNKMHREVISLTKGKGTENWGSHSSENSSVVVLGCDTM
jgi:hypothetical protein